MRNLKEYFRHNFLYILISLSILLVAAPLLEQFLEVELGQPEFIFEHPVLFAYSAAVLLSILVAITGLCGNPILSVVIVDAAFLLLAFADNAKLEVRGEHIFPEEFLWLFRADQLSGMYDASEFKRVLLYMCVVLIIGIVTTFIITLMRCSRVQTKSRLFPYRILPRISVFAIGFFACLLISLPFRTNNVAAETLEKIDFSYVSWSQLENFAQNGYIAAFVSQFRPLELENIGEGLNYSKKSIEEIALKYKAIAEAKNESRIDLASENIDVVFIMNESFADPDRFSDIYPFSTYEEEVLPNLHDVTERVSAGYIYAPERGGGTSRTEFEALTGFSNYFIGGVVPYQSLLPKLDVFPSLARTFSESGYRTIGLHPFIGEYYHRETVYPILGYGEFYDQEEFRNTSKVGVYISDAAAYEEVQDYLNGLHAVSDEAQNMFITLITMQNHIPYGSQTAESERKFISTADGSTEDRLAISDYMTLVHYSDIALGDFVEWIDGRKKKTMVVFWGDHLPGIYGELEEMNKPLQYETPFFIYANFELEKISFGSLSPNYIATTFYDVLEAKKTPWDYLLADLKKEIPILTASYWGEEELPESEALEEYKLIEYDMLIGKQYALDMGLFDF